MCIVDQGGQSGGPEGGREMVAAPLFVRRLLLWRKPSFVRADFQSGVSIVRAVSRESTSVAISSTATATAHAEYAKWHHR